MSAIWGALSLNGAKLPDNLGARMREAYAGCAIDRFEEYSETCAAFGCGIQYFTPEAERETLPLANDQFIFTADVVLDNRDELLARLGLDAGTGAGASGGPSGAGAPPDGWILCEMFARYGEECLNDLLGAYAFVFYDRREGKLSLVSDVTGNRCLYYRISENILYFSTLINPIIKADGCEGINERWIIDFIAMDDMGTGCDFEETPYAGIYKVAPRQIVTYCRGSLQKKLYWQPDTSLLELDGDEAYAAQLRKIFTESVRCLLRTDETGLMLSGGLDSTAVACYAAPILRGRGKTLRTYTSVPEQGYVSRHSQYHITDESENVLKTRAFLESKGCKLACNFISLSGADIWGSRKAMMELMESPYKSLQNILWSLEGLRMARRDGARLMLNGGFGNSTISLNNINSLFFELLRRRKFITYIKQMVKFGREYKSGKRKLVRNAFNTAREYYAPGIKSAGGESIIRNSYASRTSLDSYGVVAKYAELKQRSMRNKVDYDCYRKALVHDQLFHMKGEVNTKFSMATSILTRDPTMDKRLIEFCIRLPADQFTRDGMARRLVRTYLAPDMPEHVMAINRRGLQSADFLDYIQKNWAVVKGDLLRIYNENAGSPLVDIARALADIDSIDGAFNGGGDGAGVKDFDVMRLGYTAMALEFINKNSIN